MSPLVDPPRERCAISRKAAGKTKESRVRVLCVSPFFAPIANPEAYCAAKLVLHLLNTGAELTVLSVDYTGHAKFNRDDSSIWERLAAITSSIPPSGNRSKWTSIPLALRYQTPEWARWIAAVAGAARRLHKEHPFDVVYSRSYPNVAHVAAYWIAGAIRRPWVANFNDPWDFESQDPFRRQLPSWKTAPRTWLSHLWLARVARTADMMTFPSARLRDHHLRQLPLPCECRIVPHVGHACPSEMTSKTFEMVHAGRLGTGESTRRDSTLCLLRALRTFLESRPEAGKLCRLVLVGPQDPPTLAAAEQMGLSPYVCCTGRLSYAESLNRIAQATVCLLVEGTMSEGIYLPSKFPDYVRAGRPVIALSPAIGTINDLTPSRGITRVAVDNATEIQKAITRHFDAFVEGSLDSFAPTEQLRGLYDGDTIAGALADIFLTLKQTRRLDEKHLD